MVDPVTYLKNFVLNWQHKTLTSPFTPPSKLGEKAISSFIAAARFCSCSARSSTYPHKSQQATRFGTYLPPKKWSCLRIPSINILIFWYLCWFFGVEYSDEAKKTDINGGWIEIGKITENRPTKRLSFEVTSCEEWFIQLCFKTWWWTAGASGRLGYTLEMLCHIPLPPLEKRFSKYTMLIWFQPKIWCVKSLTGPTKDQVHNFRPPLLLLLMVQRWR